MADFEQICLIACFTDLSLNDRVDSMERTPSDELLRPWQFHLHHREGTISAACRSLPLMPVSLKLITIIMNLSYLCG